MHLSKFIDILRGKGGRQHLAIISKQQFLDQTKLIMAELMHCAINAEAFDFGQLHFEKSGDYFSLPNLTADEREFYVHKLIPFPADYCWFEFTLDTPSAILVDATQYGTKGVIRATRLDFTDGKSIIPFTGIWSEVCMDHIDRVTVECKIPGAIQWMHATQGSEWLQNHFADSPILAMYFNLMLNSRTTEITRVRPNSQSNQLRRLRGLTPLPSHRVVTIISTKFRNEPGECKNGEPTHRKRLHWRRSHLRHFSTRTPGSVWAEQLEHNGEKGWWVVTIPRFLVGKREEGEVTHEYRFATSPITTKGVQLELQQT